MDQMVIMMIILVILINMTVEIMEVIYHRINFISYFYHLANVKLLCSFINVTLFTKVILCSII